MVGTEGPDRGVQADLLVDEPAVVELGAGFGGVPEFDEPLDLRAGRLARLVGGSLRGQVTIRGTQSSVGANDDIELVTPPS